QGVLARLGLAPIEAPEGPAILGTIPRIEGPRMPGTLLELEFHAGQGRAIAPRGALDAHRAVLETQGAGGHRFNEHWPDAGLAPEGLVGPFLGTKSDIFARHVFAHDARAQNFDAAQPLYPRDPEPTGHDQTQRGAMRGVEGFSIHF